MYTNIKFIIAGLAAALALTACTPNSAEEVVPPPSSEDAAFTFEYDPENPNRVTFNALTETETWYTHWSFGDNTAAEGMAAEKLYPLSGEYEVRFKIFTEGGTAQTTQTVSIERDLIGPNLLVNGELEGDQGWTILPISPGVEVTFQDGKASWSGGGWGQAGIYQALDIEAGQAYQINMDIEAGGLSDCWFEVYVGRAEPTPGVDYTEGGIRLGLNTWDGCGSDPIQAQLIDVSCSAGGGDGTFDFAQAGTVYLVIRGGGADYGNPGVTIDNVSVRPL